jgi:hypothetical protein
MDTKTIASIILALGVGVVGGVAIDNVTAKTEYQLHDIMVSLTAEEAAMIRTCVAAPMGDNAPTFITRVNASLDSPPYLMGVSGMNKIGGSKLRVQGAPTWQIPGEAANAQEVFTVPQSPSDAGEGT